MKPNAAESVVNLGVDLIARAAVQADDLLAVDLDTAAIGIDQAEDAFQQHRLADPRSADDDHRFGGPNIEIEAAQYLVVAESNVQAENAYFWRLAHQVPKNNAVMR